jgi:hypothetical protein
MSTKKIDTEALHELLGAKWDYGLLNDFEDPKRFIKRLRECGDSRWEVVNSWCYPSSGFGALRFGALLKRRKYEKLGEKEEL